MKMASSDPTCRMAGLVPLLSIQERRTFGRWAGQVTIADDFDAPLSSDVVRAFEALTTNGAPLSVPATQRHLGVGNDGRQRPQSEPSQVRHRATQGGRHHDVKTVKPVSWDNLGLNMRVDSMDIRLSRFRACRAARHRSNTSRSTGWLMRAATIGCDCR